MPTKRPPSDPRNLSTSGPQTVKRPVCQKCVHYRVTWIPEQPHSCGFFGFRSARLPAEEVQQSCGLPCPQFRLSKAHQDLQPKPFETVLSETAAESRRDPDGAGPFLLGEEGILG